jgi:predicted DsbA family dithiol-disulfide isomerase
MNPIEIDIYSDFVCPWCFVGSRRLQQALGSFNNLDVVIRHHPYLLYPNISADGVDLRDSLALRYGHQPGLMFVTVEAAGREAGLPLDFSTVTRVYSTVDAHTLVRHAQQRGTASPFAEDTFAACATALQTWRHTRFSTRGLSASTREVGSPLHSYGERTSASIARSVTD